MASRKRLESAARSWAATRKKSKSSSPKKVYRSTGRTRSAAWKAKWEKDFLAVATPKAKRDYFATKRKMMRMLRESR